MQFRAALPSRRRLLERSVLARSVAWIHRLRVRTSVEGRAPAERSLSRAHGTSSVYVCVTMWLKRARSVPYRPLNRSVGATVVFAAAALQRLRGESAQTSRLSEARAQIVRARALISMRSDRRFLRQSVARPSQQVWPSEAGQNLTRPASCGVRGCKRRVPALAGESRMRANVFRGVERVWNRGCGEATRPALARRSCG